MRKSIFSIFTLLAGMVVGAFGIAKFAEIEMEKERQNVKNINQIASKHLELFLLMNQWVKVKQRKKSIADYLEKKGYNRIAIYGMSYVGDTLAEELRKSNVRVLYGIDQKADSLGTNLDVVTIEDRLDKVDAIIVTAITFYDEIKSELCKKVEYPIISLKDILYEI